MPIKEYDWGCELSAVNTEYVWDEDYDGHFSRLVLKEAALGVDAVVGELNVVELDTTDFCYTCIKQPLVRLTAGKVEECNFDILLTEMFTKLRLIRGSGPVHIYGHLLVEEEHDMHSLDEIDDEDNLEDDIVNVSLNKSLNCIEELDEQQ